MAVTSVSELGAYQAICSDPSADSFPREGGKYEYLGQQDARKLCCEIIIFWYKFE